MVKQNFAGRILRLGLAVALAGLAGGCGLTEKVSRSRPAEPPAVEAPAAQVPAETPPEKPAEMPAEAPAAAPEEMPAEARPEPALPPALPGFEEGPAVAPPPMHAEPQTYTVVVPDTEYAFVPRELTIYEGDTVVWKNNSGVVHLFATIPGSDPTGRMEIEPQDLLVGAEVPHTFNIAGTYPYFCFIHNRMTGKIVVLPRK